MLDPLVDPMATPQSLQPADENTPLLQDSSPKDIVAAPLTPSARQDARLLLGNAWPLVLAGLLQHSIGLSTIYHVGHLGAPELGAVSLSIMTANVTGYAVYQGMATALDTLCAQAFGSRKPLHVGLYFQQMLLLLWLLTVPIGIIWWNAGSILATIVPDQEVARLAGTYMRVLLLGAPGYAAFEAGKKFLQAQGIFSASTVVLVFVAPVHMLMSWALVSHLGLGFIGAPVAAALTNNLLPLGLLLYVIWYDGSECWNGVTSRALRSWGPMVRLALPGFVMLEAEFLAFEILTLAASQLSSTHLAAQSILSPLIALTFQAPYALSIVASNTVAAAIGAGSAVKARGFAKTACGTSLVMGVLNFLFIIFAGPSVTRFLTNEESVIKEVVKVLPVIATFQSFDCLATTLNGLLRGLGKQAVGSYVGLFCYYAIAMPTSMVACFWFGWELIGLWSGIAVALALHSILVGCYLLKTSWEKAVQEGRERHGHVLVE